MGGLLSINIESSYKKNQAFIDDMMNKTMETQLQAQNAMMERQKAIAIASSREFFHWFATFYATAATGLILGYKKTKNPSLMVPLVPLSFIVTYYWDLAYGNKIDRIRLDAENVMVEERNRLAIPHGLPTPQVVEKSLRTPEQLLQDTERQLQAASKLKFITYNRQDSWKTDA